MKNVEFFQGIQEVEKAGYRACKRCKPEVEHSPHIEVVKKVIGFLVNNYKQKLELQEIANHVGLSPYYLERLFKEETGETPRSYLEKIRIDKAVYLLKNTSLTNLEVSYETGFQSSSNFYKVFRCLQNCSPSEYRKQKDKDELDG